MALCQLDIAKVLLEEVTSIERMTPADWSVPNTVVHFLIDD